MSTQKITFRNNRLQSVAEVAQVLSNQGMTVDELISGMVRLGLSNEDLERVSGVPAMTIYRIVNRRVKKPQRRIMTTLESAVRSVEARRAAGMGSDATDPVNVIEFSNWFGKQNEEKQALWLMQLLLYASDSVRKRAIDAARAVEQMVKASPKEGESRAQAGGQAKPR